MRKAGEASGALCCFSRSVLSETWQPHGLQPTRLLSPWDSPGNNWSGLPFPSPGDLPAQALNPRLLHWQAASLLLSY